MPDLPHQTRLDANEPHPQACSRVGSRDPHLGRGENVSHSSCAQQEVSESFLVWQLTKDQFAIGDPACVPKSPKNFSHMIFGTHNPQYAVKVFTAFEIL